MASLDATSPRNFLLALAAVTLVGCGGDPSRNDAVATPPTQPVKGQVLLADGKPLTTGQVYMVPVDTAKGMECLGKIDSGGTFTLKTITGKDGAPEGEYRVRIDPDPAAPSRPTKKGEPALPYDSRYGDEASSELTVTIKSGPNDLKLELKPLTARPKSAGRRD